MLQFNRFFVLITILAISTFSQTKWTFDKTHTQVKFSVTHLVITEVEGNFTSFDGNVETEGESFDNAKINFSIDVASINTDNEKRDGHLKSDDFFSAENSKK